MECLIFSDSHGHTRQMREVLRTHKNVDAVFFLGDGLSDIFEMQKEYPEHTYFCVRGNCDFSSSFMGCEIKKTDEVNLMGKNVVFTHGDLYGAKYGPEGLISLGKSRNADVVLFGHTHEPCETYMENTYLFNPGSIGEGRDGKLSFGLMTITEQGILFSHGSAD